MEAAVCLIFLCLTVCNSYFADQATEYDESETNWQQQVKESRHNCELLFYDNFLTCY